ncbi:MAG: ABC transporter ATP-binding protein [Chloroflexota bacterium]|nr:ABC transporter ATP-binding protein [Chloroflexota bacterium]
MKRFGSVEALAGVDFDLQPGEIHALLGENGAGKTTLMNVLYGMFSPDAGTVLVSGEERRFRSPHDAIAAGIGMVHQHFMLVPTLTVTENAILGQHGGPLLGNEEKRAVAARLRELAERYGLDVNPDARVWQLSVGEQQRVEILRALYRDARVLVLDEPTASLTPVETARLFPKLRLLAADGASIVFITHHLEDVIEWADRITVLRRGKRVGALRPEDGSPEQLARMMVGRDVKLMRVVAGEVPAELAKAGATQAAAPPALIVEQLRASGDRGTPTLHDVSLSVSPGEILAIAGVEGNGQPELEEALFGLRGVDAGTVRVDGRDVTTAEPAERLRAGLGLVPSDRYRRGVIRQLSVAENLVLDRIGHAPFGSGLRLDRRAIIAKATELIERYSIRVSSPNQLAGTLSGGNAQRLVLARTLSRELRCLVAAQPTRGLDVGAIEFVWEQLAAARDRGVAILLISTDLDEVMAMADRCCVLYRGRLVGEWPREKLDRDQVGLAMGGASEGTVPEPTAAARGRNA